MPYDSSLDLKRDKIEKIELFINEFMEDCKTKPMRYGSIEQLETSFYLLDNIYMIIEGLEKFKNDIFWFAFLRFKGFGPKTASMIIRERYPEDQHYSCILELRDEYYLWRENKIRRFFK